MNDAPPPAPPAYPEAGAPRRIKDLPLSLQPREMMETCGVGRVEDEVLLAVLLRNGYHGRNVRELAHDLLRKYGSLQDLARLSLQEWKSIKGIGRVKALTMLAACEMGRRIRDQIMSDSPRISAPGDVAVFMGSRAEDEVEKFWILPLNKKNRLITREPVLISSGLMDMSLVRPREVFRAANQTMCASVILAHNHPSGDPSPSAEDVKITREIVAAGRVMGIEVLDHVVLGTAGRSPHSTSYFSLREAGLVSFEVE